MECPHLAQSVRLGANDVETTCSKDLPFVCAEGPAVVYSTLSFLFVARPRDYIYHEKRTPDIRRDSGKNHRDGGDGDCDGNGNTVVQ
ncbi:hypothetical protein HZH68_015927 [Vespula germanica]|uniref:Uncharacterized protein n=1 Tax=Vespula germanica TaxID=30212 RepID=A0A834J3Y3_VESGE|nr:hypothetical protein HZH68_015927 [Vespula germanica]